MSYALFIDDDEGKEGMAAFRSPPDDGTEWKVAHSSDEAISIVKEFGVPNYMSLDHDLGVLKNGETDTVMIFLKWLSQEYPYSIIEIRSYRVHSMNPLARQNIDAYMNSWARSLDLQED